MPIRQKTERQGPTLRTRKRRGGKQRRARQGVKVDNRTRPVVPQFGRKPLPDLERYPLNQQGEPRTHLCPAKDFEGEHEVDMQFAGWAKGYDDGTFDVSCKLCGEVGSCDVKLRSKDVTWG